MNSHQPDMYTTLPVVKTIAQRVSPRIKFFSFIVLFIILNASYISAQSLSQPLTEDEITEIVEDEVDKRIGWMKWIGGGTAALTAYALYMWFFGIRKITDKRIEERVDHLISEKLSEKTGVKLETLKQFLSEAAKKVEAKNKNILVLSKTLNGKKAMTDFLEKGGFLSFSFKTSADMPIHTNGVYLVLVDNEPIGTESQVLDDNEVKQIFDHLKGQVKIAYIGRQVGREIFENYKDQVVFTNNKSYLHDNLTNALMN